MNACYTIRWFVTIFIGLVLAASGACKLLGDPAATSWFAELNIPAHYMRGLGVVELVGAVASAIAIAVWGTPGHPVKAPEPRAPAGPEPHALPWQRRFAGQGR